MRTLTLISTMLALTITTGCDLLDQSSGAEEGAEEPTTDTGEDTIGGTDDGDGTDDDISEDALEGTIISDLGYRPQPDGYSFQNYSNDGDIANLSAQQLRNLLGPDVCSDHLVTCTPEDEADGYCTDSCVLTPQARTWMDKNNDYMDGGHCYGMAVSSELVFNGDIDIAYYDPSASSTYEAQSTTEVQEFVAVWWTSQRIIDKGQRYTGSANDVVSYLRDQFDAGEPMTLLLWGDVKGGHAVTPFAIAQLDDGTQRIYVYDNNFPGANHYVEVDPATNSYSFSSGDWRSTSAPGHEMQVDPLYLQADVLLDGDKFYDCTFCETGGTNVGLVVEGGNEVQIESVGDGQTFVGQGINWDLSALEDAALDTIVKSVEENPIPQLTLPAAAYAFAHTAESVEPTHLSLSGDGVVSQIEGMVGETAQAFISEDGHSLGYLSSGDEQVTLSVATHHDDADYSFALDVGGGADMLAKLDVNEQLEQIEITLQDGSTDHTIELNLERHSGDLTETISFPTDWHGEDVIYIVRYGDWAGGDAELDVEIVLEGSEDGSSQGM